MADEEEEVYYRYAVDVIKRRLLVFVVLYPSATPPGFVMLYLSVISTR